MIYLLAVLGAAAAAVAIAAYRRRNERLAGARERAGRAYYADVREALIDELRADVEAGHDLEEAVRRARARHGH